MPCMSRARLEATGEPHWDAEMDMCTLECLGFRDLTSGGGCMDEEELSLNLRDRGWPRMTVGP
jgi:hypothetical protein